MTKTQNEPLTLPTYTLFAQHNLHNENRKQIDGQAILLHNIYQARGPL